jgi:hypothetical protein
MWPCVPLVVNKKYLGIAYGVAFSIQNVGLALFPLVIAYIYDNSNDQYIPNVEIFFSFMALAAVFTGIYLCYIDRHYCDSILNTFVVGTPDGGGGDDAFTGGEYSELRSDDCEESENETGKSEEQGRGGVVRRRGSGKGNSRRGSGGQSGIHGSFSSTHSTHSATPEALQGALTWQ